MNADERIKQLTKEADALAERASEILALIKTGQGTDADWQELDRIEADMTTVRVALMHALEIKAH